MTEPEKNASWAPIWDYGYKDVPVRHEIMNRLIFVILMLVAAAFYGCADQPGTAKSQDGLLDSASKPDSDIRGATVYPVSYTHLRAHET